MIAFGKKKGKETPTPALSVCTLCGKWLQTCSYGLCLNCHAPAVNLAKQREKMALMDETMHAIEADQERQKEQQAAQDNQQPPNQLNANSENMFQ